jgi:hypothetical protein
MRRATLLAATAALGATAWSQGADAARSLEDYRHFRALSIDVAGRVPTRDEIAAFEKDSFDLDGWIASQIKGPAYVSRLQRIYMDALRLQVGSSFQFAPGVTKLNRATITGPDGKPMYVFYRRGQRRTRMETDGDFCMTPIETGYVFQKTGDPTPDPNNGPHAVSQAVLDANTVLVKPWWLYADYKAASPTKLYDATTWVTDHPGFVPINALLSEPDGSQTKMVRVCKEEAQTGATGTLYAPGWPKTTPPPEDRAIPLPQDSSYAKANAGKPVSCSIDIGLSSSADCGCGVGLERCNPAPDNAFDPKGFNFTTQQPIGLDEPTDAVDQATSSWWRVWWGEEASRFLGYIFSEDRDFREVLTAKYTLVNGPLTQFYASRAPATCCGKAVNLGYTAPEPLFDPKSLPSLLPHDVQKWQLVDDRGPHAAGIMTMPVFLVKYGSRRARAHVLYNAFKCKDFIAGNIQLKPSTEPNLMIRDGCSTCHATLEPMAAYFSRIVENDWTFLPPEQFPILNPACKADSMGKISNGNCGNYYDPAFADTTNGTLRGAYPDTFSNGKYGMPGADAHAEAGPQALAEALTGDPDFPACVAQNVATSMLGRPLTADDAAFKQSVAEAFVKSGYKMSAVVQAVLSSSRYRASNNWTSTVWRKEMGQ